jgi:hypothetical protein
MNKTFAELRGRASAELHQMQSAVLRQRQHLPATVWLRFQFPRLCSRPDRRWRKAGFDEFVKMF